VTVGEPVVGKNEKRRFTDLSQERDENRRKTLATKRKPKERKNQERWLSGSRRRFAKSLSP
jgi:hypothetical protein